MSSTRQKDFWNLEAALKALESETVDSKLWAEAVEWLLLYGPPEIREIILQSSGMATREYYPSLKAQSFTGDGEPCYTVKDLAEALHLDEQELLEKIENSEDLHGTKHLFDETEVRKLQ